MVICPNCGNEFDCEDCLEKCIAKIKESKIINWEYYGIDTI